MVKILGFALLTATMAWCDAAREPFVIGGITIQPGTAFSLDLPVSPGVDPSTYIPVTVFHGTHPGPIFAITAGIHGYEYPPILAAQELIQLIDPLTLSGTVILVRICHVAAFERRMIFYNPHDGKNLNRVFPGNSSGTQTERIADVISREVLHISNFHVDLHSGDGAERLHPWVGIYGGKLADQQFAKSREIGLAFRFTDVVTYQMETQAQIDKGRSCNRQSVAERHPTVLVECGGFGSSDRLFTSQIVEGVLNALRTLKMTQGAVHPPLSGTIWMESGPEVDSPADGIWEPLVSPGEPVKKGQKLGTIRDYKGRVLVEPVVPASGVVLSILATPPVRKGETLLLLGIRVNQ